MKRRWLFWFLVLLAVWLVIGRIASFSKLGAVLGRGDWGWVALAAALQAASYVMYATLYWVAFATVHVGARVLELVPVVFSSVFVNLALPSGGASGVALFIDNASRRGQSPGRAAAGVLLVLVVDFSVFTVLLGLGMANLALIGQLHPYDITAAGILLALIGGLSLTLLLGLWQPTALLQILKWSQRKINRIAGWFNRPGLLAEDWAAVHAMDFSAASVAIAQEPRRLIGAFMVAMIAHMVNLASLYVLFPAFYGQVDIGLVLAGYAIGNLFWIVSITPQGTGVVETVMTVVYTSLGIPVADAAAIVLVYRGLSFWLPFAVGSVMLPRLRVFTELPPPEPREHTALHKPPVP